MKFPFIIVNIMNRKNNDMPTIGVVGVTIPGATDCINKINHKCQAYFNHYEHPNIILHQLNFAPIHQAQNTGRWDIVENRLLESIEALNKLGTDFVIIPANTVHKVISSLQSRSPIPIISMLDVVADACEELKLKKIGIIGTHWTMIDHLYSATLTARRIEEIIPTVEDQTIIQKAIFQELIPAGKASDKMISALLGVVHRLKIQGCDGIALACTELPLVLNDKNCETIMLDTTSILAEAAVKKAISLKLNNTPCKYNVSY